MRITACLIVIVALFVVPQAWGDSVLVGSLADAANYVVLYTGTGGHNLQITNVTVGGNIGVGGTGKVHFNGPGTISGEVDFSAANTGQFSNNNGSNIGPTAVNYNQSNVSTDLTNLAAFSAQLGSATATNLILNNTNQTIDITTGTLNANGSYIFQVTSYLKGDGDMLTINGDGVHSVVFDFAAGKTLRGDVTLGGGLTPDMVVWNFGGTANAGLNSNASSYGNVAFQGIILGPQNGISITNSNLIGRVFGGNSKDMQIVSGTTITAPPPSQVPEPRSLVLLGSMLIASMVRRMRASR